MQEEDARQIDAQLLIYQTKVDELNEKYRDVKTRYDVTDAAFTQARDQLHSITERTAEYRVRTGSHNTSSGQNMIVDMIAV